MVDDSSRYQLKPYDLAVLLVAKDATTGTELTDALREIRAALIANPNLNIDDLAATLQSVIAPLVFKLTRIANFMPINLETVGNFDTLKDALASITDATTTKRYAIIVSPGTHTEDNSTGPIDMKSFVSIVGWGHAEAVRIVANTAGNDLFRAPLGVDDFAIGHVTLEGPTTAGKFCFVNESGNRQIYLETVHFANCDGGSLTKGNGSFTHHNDCVARDTVAFPFEVQAGTNTEARCFSCDVRPGASATAAFRANGGVLDVLSSHADSATDGVRAEAGGTVKVQASHMEKCTNALHLGTGGADNKITAIGVYNDASATNDVLSDANVGFENTLEISSTNIDPNKVTVDAATFTLVDLLSPAAAFPDFLGTGEPGLYASTVNTGTDIIRYTKIFVPDTVKITHIRINAQVSRNARIGIYRDSDDTKVAESAVTATGTGVVDIILTSAVFLTPGTYWLAYVHDSPGQVTSLLTNTGFQEAEFETGPGSQALPATKTGTTSASKMLMLAVTG